MYFYAYKVRVLYVCISHTMLVHFNQWTDITNWMNRISFYTFKSRAVTSFRKTKEINIRTKLWEAFGTGWSKVCQFNHFVCQFAYPSVDSWQMQSIHADCVMCTIPISISTLPTYTFFCLLILSFFVVRRTQYSTSKSLATTIITSNPLIM